MGTMIELCDATEDNPFIQGMSKQFVKALEQLFDVMDVDNSGTIKYADLASQWEEDNSDPFFPKGLSTCLAKVTLPNGLLTFDRFCAGIKLCLLKNQVELKEAQDAEAIAALHEQSKQSGGIDRPPSEPQIFAPPPPPPLGPGAPLSNEINNNTSLANKNSLSFHSVSTTATTSTTNSTNEESIKAKKLPLPSYEQAMATISKSSHQLPLDSIPTVNSVAPYQNGCEDMLSGANGHSKQFPPNTRPKPNLALYGKALPSDDLRRNFNLAGLAALSNESTRYPSESFTQRAKSMSHLDNLSPSGTPFHAHLESAGSESKNHLASEHISSFQSSNQVAELRHQSSASSGCLATRPATQNGHQPKTLSRNCILKTLQSWRDNILHKQVPDSAGSESAAPKNGTDGELSPKSAFDVVASQNALNEMTSTLSVSSLKRNVPKRREPRRHTVGANGVDLYAIKRYQQLEQEKDILIRGLSEIDKTKEWYIRQIACLQDKVNFAGRSGSFANDCNIDAAQERINFQSARIQNVNQHLTALREANQTYPLHMNLAIRPFNGVRVDPNQPKQLVLNPNLVIKLKQQNRALTDEVGRKSDRITQLEREKSSLIRELFQARTYSSYYNGDCDDTLM